MTYTGFTPTGMPGKHLTQSTGKAYSKVTKLRTKTDLRPNIFSYMYSAAEAVNIANATAKLEQPRSSKN